jgi:hypothetical protein
MLTNVILASSLAMSAVPLKIQESVDMFMTNLTNGALHGHKSGLVKKNLEYAPLGKAIVGANELNPEAAMPEWKRLSNPIFVSKPDSGALLALGSLVSARIGSLQKKQVRIFGDEVVINDDHADSMNTIQPAPAEGFDFKQNLAFYQGISDSVLNDMKGAVELDNFEISFLDDRQVSIGMRYRRIFRGGVVRGNNAFVYVDLDRSGKVHRVRAKWPTMEKVSGEQANLFQKRIRREIKDVYVTAQDYFASVPIRPNKPEKAPKAVRATLDGSAFAWIPEEMGQVTLIKPGVSFIGSVEFEDGTVVHPYADVPLF